MDVADWLRSVGLERYAQAFDENDVDAAVLLSLTADDLIGLGVTSIGHRRRLLDASRHSAPRHPPHRRRYPAKPRHQPKPNAGN
jgi:hypothetical protein